ncbi:Crp/Fnr family transcriptional regulator [bacterium]|nr:Crp/Fnr family transcriptional regulator [bacterium]MBU3956106.1 Crp/Fnr family transcriptional regulator [bacterium]
MVEKDILKKIPVFSALAAGHLSRLGKISEVRSFKKGDILVSEKSPGKMLFFVISGRIKIYKSASTGHIKVLSYLDKGDIFGEMIIFGGGVRSASAEAMTSCRILIIRAKDFKVFALRNTHILLKIISTLIIRLKKADDEIKSLAYNTVISRTAFTLLEFAEQYGIKKGGKTYINFPLTHVEIANNVGSSREVISRVLSKLETLKYVECLRGKIAILNPSGLKKVIY